MYMDRKAVSPAASSCPPRRRLACCAVVALGSFDGARVAFRLGASRRVSSLFIAFRVVAIRFDSIRCAAWRLLSILVPGACAAVRKTATRPCLASHINFATRSDTAFQSG